MEQPPFDMKDTHKEYLVRQFNDLNSIDHQQMDVMSALPTRTSKGRLYYFDRAIAPNITSEGYWGYTSAGWVKLG